MAPEVYVFHAVLPQSYELEPDARPRKHLMLAALLLALLATRANAQLSPDVGITVPGVALGSVSVLSPSSVRVTGTIDPNNLAGGTTARVSTARSTA